MGGGGMYSSPHSLTGFPPPPLLLYFIYFHGKKVFFGCEGGWGCGEGSQRKFSLHANKNREGNIFFHQDNFFFSTEVISTQRNISSWIDKHFLPYKKTFPFTNFFLGQCVVKLEYICMNVDVVKLEYICMTADVVKLE